MPPSAGGDRSRIGESEMNVRLAGSAETLTTVVAHEPAPPRLAASRVTMCGFGTGALAVADVAAYSLYAQQRHFALVGGVD